LNRLSDIQEVFPHFKSGQSGSEGPLIKERLNVGQMVSGRVIARAPFGVWLDIGVGRPALLLVVNMNDAGVQPIAAQDYPPKGAIVDARISSLGAQGEIGLTQLTPRGKCH
jgi:hypothetical protein